MTGIVNLATGGAVGGWGATGEPSAVTRGGMRHSALLVPEAD